MTEIRRLIRTVITMILQTENPQVYTFNFADTVDLCKVRIHPRNSGGAVGNGAPNSCTVEVSTDGVQYTQVAQSAVTDTSLTWTEIAFAAVPASSVRLTLDSAHKNVVTTGEVELYKLVSEPSGAQTRQSWIRRSAQLLRRWKVWTRQIM